MIEQFNDFMEALDEQIRLVNKNIAELEERKANLTKAREQFVNTSRLIREDNTAVEPTVEVISQPVETSNAVQEEEKVEVDITEEDIMTPKAETLEENKKNIFVAPDGSIWDSEEEYIIAQIAGQ